MKKEGIKIFGKEAASYEMAEGIVAAVNELSAQGGGTGGGTIDVDGDTVSYEDVTKKYNDSGEEEEINEPYHYYFYPGNDNTEAEVRASQNYDMTGYIPVSEGDTLRLNGLVNPTLPALVGYKDGSNGKELYDSDIKKSVLLGVMANNGSGEFLEPVSGFNGFPDTNGNADTYYKRSGLLRNYLYIVPAGVEYVRFAAKGENHVDNSNHIKIKVEKQVSSNNNQVGRKMNFVRGYGLKAKNEAEAAFGRFNVSAEVTTDEYGEVEQTSADIPVFSVGIGSSDEDRKNGFEVREDGSIYIWYKGDYVRLQDLLNTLGGGEEGEGYASTDEEEQGWSPSQRPNGAYPYNSIVGSI